MIDRKSEIRKNIVRRRCSRWEPWTNLLQFVRGHWRMETDKLHLPSLLQQQKCYPITSVWKAACVWLYWIKERFSAEFQGWSTRCLILSVCSMLQIFYLRTIWWRICSLISVTQYPLLFLILIASFAMLGLHRYSV